MTSGRSDGADTADLGVAGRGWHLAARRMAGRIVIALATNLLARGFATAAPGRTARDGTPTHVLYVLTVALTRALAFKEPDLAVAVLDEDGALPDELAPQRELLARLFEAHGVAVVTSRAPEHLLASYAQAARDAGHDVVIVGSDKRLAQLVDDHTWWYDAYKDVRYTPELVRKRFEVGPAKVAEWLALVGDDDALGGVKGLGKRGATQLIEEWGSVGEALLRTDEIAGRLGKALKAARDAVPVELARARLDRDRPLPIPLADLAFVPPEASELQALYTELGFRELLSATSSRLDVSLCDSEAALADGLARFEATPVALQALTEDPSPVRGALAGVALVQDEVALYVPFAGKGEVLREGPARLAGWFADPSILKIGHDLGGLAAALGRHSINLAGVIGDSACASHLHEPSNFAPHDLSVVAPRLLERAVPEEDSVRGVGLRRKAWSAIATDRAAAYATDLARASADVWAALEPSTDRELLTEYLALSETLTRMQSRGIACDADDLARSGEAFEEMVTALEEQIHRIAGKRFNVNSTKQLGAVLFEDLGLTIVKKTKTGWSTATDALERIQHEHPIVPLVIRYRLLRRLIDAWVTGLIGHISPDGRVHATMFAARSFSGRVICAAPDLGRVPGKTSEMARIRHAFRAAPGHVILSVDYRQLGLYVLAHLTKDPALIAPLRDRADMHRLTASAVLERPDETIGPDERQLGKVVNFATFAGQGASALALELGVTAQRAKEIIARFDRRYAVVRAFQDDQLRLARDQGFVVTLAGRRWPIAGLDSPDVMMRAYAERLARRATHEGSVADVSRRGLLHADRALRAAGLRAAPLLQVHDEVLFEVPEAELEEAAKLAAEAMQNAFALEVPLRVGVEAGPNWADLEELHLE
jgi:DNA polymerase I